MKRWAPTFLLLAFCSAVIAAPPNASAPPKSDTPRTADGHPDLSGNYDAATLTPLQRPREYGDNLYLTLEQAEAIEEKERRRAADPANEGGGKGRGAPPVGGDGSSGGEGNVGGYNSFWTDRGKAVVELNGKFRTSIIVDPKNGRQPAMTEAAIERLSERRKMRQKNDGTAWWLDREGPGPYDGPESLGIAERCILGFTGSAPTYPSLYNNYKRIVQTKDHVMILIEMVHDARIVRLSSEHPSPDERRWLGDSIGWWEGDTLVVDTTNFHPRGASRGASENLHVVERFTRQENGDLLYRFTVDDPTVWTGPWTGEYTWRARSERVYEYACHEGNYSMGGILRGARLLEQEASGGR